MEDKWIKDLRDKMAGFEIDAPEGLWNDIERSAAGPQPRRKRKFSAWLYPLSGAAAAIAILVSLFFYVGNDDLNQIQMTPYAAESGSKAMPDDAATGADMLAMNEAYEQQESIRREPLRAKDSHVEPMAEYQDVLPENPVSDTDGETPADVEEAQSESAESDAVDGGPQVHQGLLAAGRSSSGSTVRDSWSSASKPRHDNGFSIGISSSGAFAVDLNKGYLDDMYVASDAVWDDSPQLGMLVGGDNRNVITDYEHHQPVRMGLSVKYAINNRLSLGSGVTYAILNSDIKHRTASRFVSGQQRLHYVGIPLDISYRILSWKRLSLYGSAGVLGEKCVSGKIVSDYWTDDNSTTRVTERTDALPFQISINASAGIQFDIIRQLGVYVEPGISYYFNDGTAVDNIYKDKPLNFNINVGLRLNIGRR